MEKTIIVKPVLVKSEERTNLAIVTKQYIEYAIDYEDIDILHEKDKLEQVFGDYVDLSFYKCKKLIFIGNEKIDVGDIGYINIGEGIIGKVTYDDKYNTWDLTTIDNVHYPFSSKEYIKKVIATQDQIPKHYIQQFIEEYNSGKVNDVEIEMEMWGTSVPNLKDYTYSEYTTKALYIPKLTNGFINVVNKSITLIIKAAEQYENFSSIKNNKLAFIKGALSKEAEEYHTQGKYCEKEARKLCSKVALIRFSEENMLEEFDNWFNKNKK